MSSALGFKGVNNFPFLEIELIVCPTNFVNRGAKSHLLDYLFPRRKTKLVDSVWSCISVIL